MPRRLALSAAAHPLADRVPVRARGVTSADRFLGILYRDLSARR